MTESFEEIRLRCKREGKHFVDPEFVASSRSIYFTRSYQNHLSAYRVKWMRPHEICKLYDLESKFFVDGGSRFDLNQGELGDCWVVAAAACLSEEKRLLDRVVPPEQNFSNDWYAGVFHFRFWQYGNWVDVIVDDLLPTVHGRLIFIRSNQINEFWGALLEKAYAKLHGSYEALVGGTNGDALTDFTGGVMETYLMSQPPPRLPHLLHKAFERNSLVAASIYFQKEEDYVNEVLQSGLVVGHAYSVTSIKKVKVDDEVVHLVRIRNPWGNSVEWRGPWGDQSPEWKLISSVERQNLGLVRRRDGEFWMDLKDFIKHFDSVEICNLTADSLSGFPKKWTSTITHSKWNGRTAGGNIRNPTFWNNPQISFKVEDHDEDDDSLASFIIELMNKDFRGNATKLAIGFVLFKLKVGAKLPLGRDFHRHSTFVSYTGHMGTRTVTKRFLLPADDYVVIPTTHRPNREGEFSLRIISESTHSTGYTPKILPIETNVIDGSTSELSPSQLRKYFDLLAGEDNAADAVELKKMLDYALKLENCGHLQLKVSTCKRLVALVDPEYFQKLEYQEFMVLWYQIREWLVPFKKYEDKKGSINVIQLKNCFLALDYNLDQELVKKLIFRYSDIHGHVSFNSYVKCMAKLQVLFSHIRRSVFHGKSPCDMRHELEWMNSAALL